MPDSGTPASLVAVVGGESTGKSTLARSLAERLPGTLVTETLREWVALHGRVPDQDEQREVFAAHVEAEAAAVAEAPVLGLQWVISDSGPLMTAVYSIQYYGADDLLEAALDTVATHSLVVWCADDFPWQPDRQRDGAAARARSQEVLASIFADNPHLPILRVNGSLAARVDQVCQALTP